MKWSDEQIDGPMDRHGWIDGLTVQWTDGHTDLVRLISALVHFAHGPVNVACPPPMTSC